MKTENQLIVSAVIFGLVVSLFVLFFAKFDNFIFLLVISMFFSYWFGRLYERKIKNEKYLNLKNIERRYKNGNKMQNIKSAR